MITDELTVAKLTPPGYFNLAENAPANHKAYIQWWNNILAQRATQAEALRTMILTPWLVDWDDTAPRAPWLNKLLSDYGYGFFGGNNTQAAALYRMVSSAWRVSAFDNFKIILDALCLPPFNWFDVDYIPRMTSGSFVPGYFDTGFIIYSTNPSPSAPASVAYVPRAWVAPTGWTRKPSSAQSYARGYISGGNIVWCPVRPIADFSTIDVFAAPDVPLSVPSAGTVCIVNSDGSGDRNSIYYSDGSEWRKNSMPNADLGKVIPGENRPIPEAGAVWAPNPVTAGYAITSEVPPPAAGRTQGFGTFFTYSRTAIYSGTLELSTKLIAGGDIALATLIQAMRRVKPATQLLTVKVNIDDVVVPFVIDDMRATN